MVYLALEVRYRERSQLGSVDRVGSNLAYDSYSRDSQDIIKSRYITTAHRLEEGREQPERLQVLMSLALVIQRPARMARCVYSYVLASIGIASRWSAINLGKQGNDQQEDTFAIRTFTNWSIASWWLENGPL